MGRVFSSTLDSCLQVFFHLSVKKQDGSVLESTRLDEGGSGVPKAFVLGKGRRAPRGWELALEGTLMCLALLKQFSLSLWRSWTCVTTVRVPSILCRLLQTCCWERGQFCRSARNTALHSQGARCVRRRGRPPMLRCCWTSSWCAGTRQACGRSAPPGSSNALCGKQTPGRNQQLDLRWPSYLTLRCWKAM